MIIFIWTAVHFYMLNFFSRLISEKENLNGSKVHYIYPNYLPTALLNENSGTNAIAFIIQWVEGVDVFTAHRCANVAEIKRGCVARALKVRVH